MESTSGIEVELVREERELVRPELRRKRRTLRPFKKAVSARVLLPLGVAGIGIAAIMRAMQRRRARPLTSAALGLASGLLAAPVMNRVHSVSSVIERSFERGRPHEAEGEKPTSKPATARAAEAIIGPVPEHEPQGGAAVVHYAMAGVTGLVYGLLSSATSKVRAGRGLGYGAAVWLLADELAVPALRLSSFGAPLATHVRGLLAHLVYGATLDGLMRLGRRRLQLE